MGDRRFSRVNAQMGIRIRLNTKRCIIRNRLRRWSPESNQKLSGEPGAIHRDSDYRNLWGRSKNRHGFPRPDESVRAAVPYCAARFFRATLGSELALSTRAT
jgi:hypothetical protein